MECGAGGLAGSKAHFGFFTMFEMLTDGESKVARFTTDSTEAAAQWLGRPVDLTRAGHDALTAAAEGEPQCFR